MSKNISQILTRIVQTLIKTRVILFIVLVAAIYGYVGWRFAALSNPSSNSVQTPQSLQPTISGIDQPVIDQINQLQNNSVSVQSLFNQARNNPFEE